jgi:acyl-CoA synthetase (AMP-forming)/AMP-acid ligase II
VTIRLGLIDRVGQVATEQAGTLAIVEPDGRSITRADFVDRARAMARGLVAAGLVPGDRVLFGVRPGIDAIALIVAIVEAGGVVVPVGVGAGDAVFEAQMRLVRPRWVVAESVLLAAAGSSIVRRLVRWRGGALPSLDPVSGATFVRVGRQFPWGPRATSIDSLVNDLRSGGGDAEVAIDDQLALIVFTSGTTATPKAVVHTRRSLAATLDVVGDQLAMTSNDVLYSRDLHLILPALFAGARVVIPRSTKFSPSKMAADLERYRVTHTFAVTGDCQALVDFLAHAGRKLPATLRRLLVGAAPVRGGFLERLAQRLGPSTSAACVYGMTEMLPVASISLEEKLAYDGAGDIVGRVVAGVDARISDAGELVLRGPHLFAGYLGEPPVTEHATGDLARIDDERIVLLGRAKDMIIRGEHNIYPELHEPVIERIAGVRRCAMVGVYDDALADERVVLAVEPEPGLKEDQLVDRLRGALRDGPSRIDDAAQPDLIIVTPLPESGRSNKVDKEALRVIARARLECASR